ncbi:hypothetical protein F5141DRAFT_1115540 [Pisolithus sp. B1]|nr:hypothetical protein F5141DRAFT_1115540 [Pisolithus sp. B1]
MFGFKPYTTSSPAKPLVAAAGVSDDVSRTSTTSKSELQALSPFEVEFLGAVVRRMPSNATSFLEGLKAYNDELHDRGMDGQTETVHYGRLAVGALLAKGSMYKRSFWKRVYLCNQKDTTAHCCSASVTNS